MLLTIQSSKNYDVPAGTYTDCTFSGISQIETSRGNAYRWAFETPNGITISGLSDADAPPTTKNKTGRWLSALSAQPLKDGVQVNPDDYIGKKYIVIVVDTGNGSKMETFSKLS